jgi:hypothetical protein
VTETVLIEVGRSVYRHRLSQPLPAPAAAVAAAGDVGMEELEEMEADGIVMVDGDSPHFRAEVRWR